MKKIVCFVDPIEHAESAIKNAFLLAKKTGAKLTFVRMVEPLMVSSSFLESTFYDLQKSELVDTVHRYNSFEMAVRCEVIEGELGALDVIKFAESHQADIIIKASVRKSGKGPISLFGTSDRQLLRKSAIPVWICKPGSHKEVNHILAPVDVSREQPGNVSVNKAIVTCAKMLVEVFNTHVHFVHVWSYPYERSLRSAGLDKIDRELDKALAKMESKVTADWDAFVKALPLDEAHYTTHLFKGNPENTIAAMEDELGIDTVVMGTVARTGLPGFLIGNTAERILAALDSSVITVKPAEFESPMVE